MRYVLCMVALILVVSTVASAQWQVDQSNAIAVSFDPDLYELCIEAAFLEHVHAWLVIYNPTLPVFALDCRVRLTNEPAYLITWTMVGAWHNSLEPPSFLCHERTGRATEGAVIVAMFDMLLLSDASPIEIFIEPRDESGVIRYWTLYGRPVQLLGVTGGTTIPVAVINNCYFPANESLAWGSVKSLYR